MFSQRGWGKLVEPEPDPEHTIHSTPEGPCESALWLPSAAAPSAAIVVVD